MRKKTVSKSELRIPPSVRAFFANPAVLKSENPKAFFELLCAFAEDVKPVGAVEWLWLLDIVYLTMDILRLRRFKIRAIETARECRAYQIAKSRRWDEWKAENPDKPDTRFRLPVPGVPNEGPSYDAKKLQKLTPKLDDDGESAIAFRTSIEGVARIEGFLEAAERRRNNVLREIEIRRELLARRPRETSDKIIEGKALKRNSEAA